MGHPSPRSASVQTSSSGRLFAPAGHAAHRRLASSRSRSSSSFGRQGLASSTARHSSAAGLASILSPGPVFQWAPPEWHRGEMLCPLWGICPHAVRNHLPTVISAFPVAIPSTITHPQQGVKPTLPPETHTKILCRCRPGAGRAMLAQHMDPQSQDEAAAPAGSLAVAGGDLGQPNQDGRAARWPCALALMQG